MHLPALLPSLPALLLQGMLPLALLLALALRTPQSVAGFWAHVAATALLLLATSLAGQWTVLPWWTPFVLAAALLAVGAGVYGARAGLPARRQAAGRSPARSPAVDAPSAIAPSVSDATTREPSPGDPSADELTAGVPSANLGGPRTGSGRGASAPLWPAGNGARAHLVCCMLIALVSLAACAETLRARMAAADEHAMIELQFPLGAGDYLVVEGGASRLLNAHRGGWVPGSVRGREGAAGKLANTTVDGLDLVRLNAAGLRASAPAPQDPAAYFIHGARVLAPCDGRVQAVRDDLGELDVPARDARQPLGNQVVLGCGNAIVTLAHLRAGSVRVHAGEQVTVATELAVVGNSGSSTEPMLHVHAERGGTPLSMRFDGRVLIRNDRVSVAPPVAPR